MHKLTNGLSYYEGEFGWVGHKDCHNPTKEENFLINNRNKLNIVGGVCDRDASYSYDDFALVELDGEYWLCQTSGCSCPSPSETWCVDIGPTTLEEIRAFILGGHYGGYTVPKKQESEFLELIDAEISRVASISGS